MQLSRKEIEHVARLARLELTEEEIGKFGDQLSSVLSYIDQLQEVDTTGVEPTAQVTGLQNAWREDVIEDWDEAERQNALNLGPEVEDGQLKVRRVLE